MLSNLRSTIASFPSTNTTCTMNASNTGIIGKMKLNHRMFQVNCAHDLAEKRQRLYFMPIYSQKCLYVKSWNDFISYYFLKCLATYVHSVNGRKRFPSSYRRRITWTSKLYRSCVAPYAYQNTFWEAYQLRRGLRIGENYRWWCSNECTSQWKKMSTAAEYADFFPGCRL